MGGAQWRWLDEPLLKRLPAPDPGAIVTPGGIVVAVSTPRGSEPYRWYPAAALAWARYPDGVWGVLLAWEAMFRPVDGPDRLGGRRGWCRFDPARCAVMHLTPPANPWGLEWWGRRPEWPMSKAVRAAVADLPEHLREAALRPASPEDVKHLPSVERAGVHPPSP